MGHARALLALEGERQERVAKKVAAGGLSVRMTEQLVGDVLHPKPGAGRKIRPDRDIERLEEELSGEFGTTIEIKAGRKGSGKLVISFTSPDHLEDLLKRIRR
jgi:ParB family chromosome partitioning protein